MSRNSQSSLPRSPSRNASPQFASLDPRSIRQNVAPTNSRILFHLRIQVAQSAQFKAFVFNLFRTLLRVCEAHFSPQPIYFLSLAHSFR